MGGLTEAQRRALTIVRDRGPIGASLFGDAMWPRKRSRLRGRALTDLPMTAQGAGFAGGGYLAKLAKLGLVQRRGHQGYAPAYILTEAGRRALAAPSGVE